MGEVPNKVSGDEKMKLGVSKKMVIGFQQKWNREHNNCTFEMGVLMKDAFSSKKITKTDPQVQESIGHKKMESASGSKPSNLSRSQSWACLIR